MKHSIKTKWRACAAVALIMTVIVLGTACGRANRKEEPLILRYAEKIVHLTGTDDTGKPRFSAYSGKQIDVTATIRDVVIQHHGPSISIEDSYIRLESPTAFATTDGKSHHKIDLQFDSNQLLEGDLFVKGDLWVISITPEGRLITLRKERLQP